MKIIRLREGKERSLLRHHPWVFQGSIERGKADAGETVLDHFDRHAQLQPDAPKAPYVCKDADDQTFIDLAVQHGAALHSKDAQVLCMKNRLLRVGVVLNPGP